MNGTYTPSTSWLSKALKDITLMLGRHSPPIKQQIVKSLNYPFFYLLLIMPNPINSNRDQTISSSVYISHLWKNLMFLSPSFRQISLEVWMQYSYITTFLALTVS